MRYFDLPELGKIIMMCVGVVSGIPLFFFSPQKNDVLILHIYIIFFIIK